MVIIKPKRSKKGSIYWVREHIDESLIVSEDGEVHHPFDLISDNRVKDEFEEIFERDEITKTLKMKGLDDLAVKIALMLRDGWTRAEIARLLKLNYDRVNYIFKKIRRALTASHKTT